MIDLGDLQEGLFLWHHQHGRVYGGVVDKPSKYGFYLVLMGTTKRRYVSGCRFGPVGSPVTFPEVFASRDEAVHAAEAWLLPRIKKAQARVDRLAQMKQALQRLAGPWTSDVKKADRARYSCGKPVATIKYVKRFDRWDWKTETTKGAQSSLQEAQDAADYVLRQEFWKLK